jgi:hypothetical protein
MSEFNRSGSIATGGAPGAAVAAGMLREAEAWTSTQCDLFSRVGAIWTDWLRRQQEAMDASARSLQQMCECRNPADLAQLQQEWLTGAARRCASSLSALAADSMALTLRAAGADRLCWVAEAAPAPSTAAARPKSANETPPHRQAAE